MNINIEPLEVPRKAVKFLLANEKNQLMCACKQPVVSSSVKGTVGSCRTDACKYKVFLTHVKEMVDAGTIKQWPKVTLPVCDKCQGATLMLTKVKDSNIRQPTVRCACKAWKMFTAKDDPIGFDPEYWDLTKCPVQKEANSEGAPFVAMTDAF